MVVDPVIEAPRPNKGKKGLKFSPLPGVQCVEGGLPWKVDFNNRVGRQAVATKDLPAGSLVLVEQPFLRVPISKFAAAVCFRCQMTLTKTGTAPPPGNPCLPRYCVACKDLPAQKALDGQLAQLRISMFEMANEHGLDAALLHIVTILDLQRSGIDVGAPPPLPAGAKPPSTFVACSVADYDALTSVWDRRPEAWRKKVGPALRALHKALVALADAGTVSGYAASPLLRLQADAAALNMHIHSVSGPNSPTETGVAIFPALSLFQHSCLPNAFFTTQHNRMLVRTVVDVPAGTPLTVSYVSPSEPRAARQAMLEADRFARCICSRCVAPLRGNTTMDRLVEGVVCQRCLAEVTLPVAEGAENEAAAKEWQAQMDMEAKEAEKRAEKARRALKKGAGKKAAAAAQLNGKGAAEEEQKTESEQPAAAEAEAEAAADGEKKGVEDEAATLEGVVFWRCCGCGAVEPAHNNMNTGPGDALAGAHRMLREAMAFLGVKHPELNAQAEQYLEALAAGMDGRLPQYHHLVISAYSPLITLNQRNGNAVKVLHHAIELWDADRQLLENRPSPVQMQCLEAVVDAAESKASSVNSAVINAAFLKKVKLARKELVKAKQVLLGLGLN